MLLLGRLAQRNPATLLPPLRRLLIQLLRGLQQMRGADPLGQEESARLLSRLVAACPLLVAPYVSRVLAILVPKLEALCRSELLGMAVCWLFFYGGILGTWPRPTPPIGNGRTLCGMCTA